MRKRKEEEARMLVQVQQQLEELNNLRNQLVEKQGIIFQLTTKLHEANNTIQQQHNQIITQEHALKEWKGWGEKDELYNKVLEYGRKSRECVEQLHQSQQLLQQQQHQLHQHQLHQHQINHYHFTQQQDNIIIQLEGIISEHEMKKRECEEKIMQLQEYMKQQTEKINILTTEIIERDTRVNKHQHNTTLLDTITDNICELYYQLAKH
jgi:hypothetical protein